MPPSLVQVDTLRFNLNEQAAALAHKLQSGFRPMGRASVVRLLVAVAESADPRAAWLAEARQFNTVVGVPILGLALTQSITAPAVAPSADAQPESGVLVEPSLQDALHDHARPEGGAALKGTANTAPKPAAKKLRDKRRASSPLPSPPPAARTRTTSERTGKQPRAHRATSSKHPHSPSSGSTKRGGGRRGGRRAGGRG